MALLSSPGPRRDDPSSSLLTMEVRDVGTWAEVRLAGEIDVASVGEMYEQFARLAREGVCRISLDLEKVEFMDSTGLAVLVSEQKRAESLGGEIVMFSPPSHLRRLFAVAGLESYFDIRPKSVSEQDDMAIRSEGGADGPLPAAS